MKHLFTFIVIVSISFGNIFGQSKKIPSGNQVNTFNKKSWNFANKISPANGNIKKGKEKHYSNEDFSLTTSKESFLLKPLNKSYKEQNFINSVPKELKSSNNVTFREINVDIDNNGYTHKRIQQKYKGIDVYGGIIILHKNNEDIQSINGKFYGDIQLDILPEISEKDAFELAKNEIDAEIYSWEVDSKNELKKYQIAPVGEQIILPINENNDKPDFKLCYKFEIKAVSPYSINEVFVDAKSGKIINNISKINYDNGTATTMYSGVKTITTENISGTYYLHDLSRKVYTYDMRNGTNYGEAYEFTDADNNWNEQEYTLSSITVNNLATDWWYASVADEKPDIFIKIYDGDANLVKETMYFDNTFAPFTFNINMKLNNPPYTFELWDYDAVGSNDYGGIYSINLSSGSNSFSGSGNSGNYNIIAQGNPALDAHWAGMKVYDYFQSKFSRNSYDNAGAAIYSFVHFNAGFDNAYWNGTCMTFGDGGNAFSPLSCLDVFGHEFGHAVVGNNGGGGLNYQSESGALNESFADIFGTCLEFYAKPSTANWTIGEDITLLSPYYLRSLSNPNQGLAPTPDTYNGVLWADINNLESDHGGVHTNSGVMNYWFYLLCQGGSGTNDIGSSYSVSGIGMAKAEQITYRNLIYYLTPTATYYDAMMGSIQATEDLYGAGSTEYWAVKDAWYAVGLGNTSANVYCDGTTFLESESGSVTDGSGNSNYLDNSDCMWLIQPAGSEYITLDFTMFDTENGYDSVLVYDGPDTLSSVLMAWWGNTIPPQITSSGGAMLIRFMSDGSVNSGGWAANYNSIGTAYCNDVTILSDYSGSFSDGSGGNNYGNNSQCVWYIAPPGATSITLSFSQFNTEQDYDGILVYDDIEATNQIAVLTGTSIPSPIVSSTGVMLVYFISDYIVNYSGWNASYTAIGTPNCSGISTFTEDFNFIDDGSGSSDYYNNSECEWLIQPNDAIGITFFFEEFKLEKPSEDGNTIYDYVEIYDGINSSAPLLGRYTGENIPSAVSSTGSSMFILFSSDFSVTSEGFSGYYISTTSNFCSGESVLTNQSGSFNDGSGASQYGNNSDCSWLIQPTGASSITLNFTEFNTEQDFDGIIVYDGDNLSSAILGTFTGSVLPNQVTSTGGSMLVNFVSDESVRGSGWVANYSSTLTNIDKLNRENSILIYPNPNEGKFNIDCQNKDTYIEIFDITGKNCLYNKNLDLGLNKISLNVSSGSYLLKVTNDEKISYQKIIVR